MGPPRGAGVCGVAIKGNDMLHRVLSLAAALALVGFVGVAAAADKPVPEKEKTTHNVTIVKVEVEKLELTYRVEGKEGKEGKEHTHKVAKHAKITIDGKEGTLSELKKHEGEEKATITLVKEGDEVEITEIEVPQIKKDKEPLK